MTDLTLVFSQRRQVLVTGSPALTLIFPPLFPGVTLPTDGDAGDVLTWDGDSWEALPPGSSAGLETRQAGENLSSGRVVIIDGDQAFYFQNTNIAHKGRAYGITKTSALTGADVTIQIYGLVSDAAFTFTPDTTLWVGADGEIFSAIPNGLIIQKAGVGAENDKMRIDFSIQITNN